MSTNLNQTILDQLQDLADTDLYSLSEAVDLELHRRDETIVDEPSESARRRALEREQSYRRRNGSTANPFHAVSAGKLLPRRRAA